MNASILVNHNENCEKCLLFVLQFDKIAYFDSKTEKTQVFSIYNQIERE